MPSPSERRATAFAGPRDPDRVVASTLAFSVGLVLAVAPVPVQAAPASAEAEQVEESVAVAPSESADEPTAGSAGEGEGEPETDLQPTVGEVDRGPAPSGGGVAGAIVDPDDPNAGRAQSDLEGESLDQDIEGVPERLPKMQAAGWWTTFGAVALGTTGGVLAGVAEVRQDEAERLAYSFDLETGRAQLYGEVGAEYEQLLDQGNTYQWLARGFLIGGGVTLVAAIALFSVDAAQRKRAGEQARVRVEPSAGGLSLHF